MKILHVVVAMSLGLSGAALAQEALPREVSLQLSRYDSIIAKLEDRNERLMQDIRALQREISRMEKQLGAQQEQVKGGIDELQRFKNTDIHNIKSSFWGEGRRDCDDLGVRHQQIKVTMKPDGSESVRFLCFDGKALMLGAERYVVGN